jgi:hypothetical protein
MTTSMTSALRAAPINTASNARPRSRDTVEPETPDTPRVGPWPVGHPACVFLFFSSRLGCLGSLVLSVLLTVLLLWIFRVI